VTTDTVKVEYARLVLSNEFGTLRLTKEQCAAIGKFARKDALDQLTQQAQDQGDYNVDGDDSIVADYEVKDYDLLERHHKQSGASADQHLHFQMGWEACYSHYAFNDMRASLITLKKHYDNAMKSANDNAAVYQTECQKSYAVHESNVQLKAQVNAANDLLRQCKAAFDAMKIPMLSQPIFDYFDKHPGAV